MDISHRFTQSAGWAASTAINAAGEPTYASTSTIACRFEDGPSRAREGSQGTEATSGALLWTASAVKAGDRIWPPGANTANAREAREALAVSAVPDLDGNLTFYEVQL